MFSRNIKMIAAAALVLVLCTCAAAMDATTETLCRYGTAQDIKAAVGAGTFELDGIDAEGNNPLLIAAGYNRDPEVIRVLAGLGYNIDCRNFRGATPLMEAALRSGGASEVINALIEAGAQVNCAERGGITTLMMAAYGNTPDIVELLLLSGADADACDAARGTAIYWAQQRTDGQSEAITALLSGVMRSPAAKYSEDEAQFYYAEIYSGPPFPPPPDGNGEPGEGAEGTDGTYDAVQQGDTDADFSDADATSSENFTPEAESYASPELSEPDTNYADEGAAPQVETPPVESNYNDSGLVKSEENNGGGYTVRIRRPVEEKDSAQYNSYDTQNYDDENTSYSNSGY